MSTAKRKAKTKTTAPKPARFFRTPAQLRAWFDKNHGTCKELWVGYYKRETGKPSVTWPESVGEALCVGWIDGLRKGIDQHSYKIRFTPRRPGSIWSDVNIRKVKALMKEGRMCPAGLKAFEARDEAKSRIYAYELRPDMLDEPYLGKVRANKEAWTFYLGCAPSYRRSVNNWVMSAKQEGTRLKRLERLLYWAERGEMIPEYTKYRKAK